MAELPLSLPPGSALSVVGVNHRTLPVARREELARLERSGAEDLLPALVRECRLKEAAVLSTCNRFEVVSIGDAVSGPLNEVPERIIESLQRRIERPFAPESFYCYRDAEAIKHIFRVSSSLDSMVLGESQILGQVKECYERAVQLGFAGKYLHHLFQFAFRLAKRVRSHTEVGSGGVSVSYVAVRLAEQIFGAIEGRTVLVIGSGRMAELAVIHLKSRGCRNVIVANRTVERAAELARRIGGSAIALSELDHHIGAADVVIGSIAIDRPILDGIGARRILGRRPQFFIDLGVPRNFPESLASIESVYLYTIDDLSKIADEQRTFREEAARDAEIMIEYGLFQFERWLVKVSAEPAIVDFRAQVREAVEAELRAALSQRYSGAELEEMAAGLSHRISQRVSHRLTELMAKFPDGKIDLDTVLPFVLDDFLKL